MKKYTFLILIACFLFQTSCNKDSEKETFAVNVESTEGGVVDYSNGMVDENTSISITATPNSGYRFSHWSGFSDSISTTITLVVVETINLKAHFILDSIEVNENVTYLVESLVDTSGYIFAIENGQKSCYLLDHVGNKVYEWNFDLSFGQDVELTTEGHIIGLFKIENPPIVFGGQSGVIRKYDIDSNLLWEFPLNSENEISHHDFEQLPNGNLLVLLWERVLNEQAIEVGLNNDSDVFIEKIIEINPNTNSIVWEWNSWDHIVQNYNSNLDNYGDPTIEKNKIDILYNNNSEEHAFIADGDLMHTNGIAYLPEKDIIALSVNFYSEVWIIDHSTTSLEAKTNEGGQFNKGGDLIYRFGNQNTYSTENAAQVLDLNHHPSFIMNGEELSLLILNNNNTAEASKAMEFLLPELNENTTIGDQPQIIFEYGNSDMFFPRVGGAVRLPNGNTLICEGDFGYWEVTTGGDLVWKYDGLGIGYWRGLFYEKDSPEIKALNL